MARLVAKLTALAVSKVQAKGKYGDGGGLWLQVSATGAKSWIYRFTMNGRAREMGLGPLHTVSLATARTRAAEWRLVRLDRVDPIEARKAQWEKAQLDAAKAMTFSACTTAYITAHRPAWRNTKHASQWENTLKTYADPVFGAMPVQVIDTSLVMKVLDPLWLTKPETASRLRGRIEAVLDWATARGYRTGDNPARWRGHVDKLLPARTKVRQVKHHAALPYTEVPAFIASLTSQDGTGARALAFLILTAARTNEVIGARWNEFDLKGKVWVVPASRMKGGRDHRVPLSDPAVHIVERMKTERKDGHEFLFPGGKADSGLTNMALLALLKRMNRGDLTAHGFRSTFRDWAAERTNFPREVAEMALAHAVSDKVEAAYRRGDLFEKRHKLMDAWGKFCLPQKADEAKLLSRAKQSIPKPIRLKSNALPGSQTSTTKTDTRHHDPG
jgi:integrase